MANLNFNDSVYRFTDPIRYFKANDPYYFEVDNIPLKQLQENCLWLKDQLGLTNAGISSVKRADIEELRPYATGGDRVVRVKPGRYTARVNDASYKTPLSFLTQFLGGEVAETDAYSIQVPNNVNIELSNTLDKFKSIVEENSLSINGLESRVFTWPTYSVDSPVGGDGVVLDGTVNYVKYSSETNPGAKVGNLASVISEAYTWAKSNTEVYNLFTLDLDNTLGSDGFALLPKLESQFVKYWRGIARTSVVDIDEELTIEVPPFSPGDFSYIDENGVTQDVTGVVSRIDMVFIYTKPIDASSTTILKPSGRTTITKPQLGIIRGAGIKANYSNSTTPEKGTIEFVTDDHKILASPADASNELLGFTATSSNDVAFDIRGSFPSPDDLLNLAPLLSERLEDSAIELVGQSILPIAYVWVKNEGTELTSGALPVLSTDIIDIRPFFRTTELSYNERAGIAAAMPQLSLANPAVGKAQLDYEIKRSYEDLLSKIPQLAISQAKVSFYDYANGGISKIICQETDASGNSLDVTSNGFSDGYGLFQRDYSTEYVNGGYITGTNIIFNSFLFKLNDMLSVDSYLNNLEVADGDWLNLFNAFRIVGTFKIYSEIMGNCGPAEDEEAYLRVWLGGSETFGNAPLDNILGTVYNLMQQFDDDALATLATPNELITQSLNPNFPSRGLTPELLNIHHTDHAGMSQCPSPGIQKSSLVSIVDMPLFRQNNGDVEFVVNRLKKNCLSNRYYLAVQLAGIKLYPI